MTASPSVLVGTDTGLAAFNAAGERLGLELAGRRVSALAARSTELWAIVDGREVWRTDGAGQWTLAGSLASIDGGADLEATCLADTAANPVGGILVGTSEARLLRLHETGPLEVVSGFEGAPGRDRWFTPWGGPPDTRSITQDDLAVFVNVHVGGVLRSRDQGADWEPTIDIEADIHRVVTGHGRVYAAGAYGLSVSADHGETWRLSDAGLHASYCRGVAVCGATVLLSASTGPRGRRAAVYRTDLEARRFELCRDGLPEWFDTNIDSLCLDALPRGGLAAFGIEDGYLFMSTDAGASWVSASCGGKINCVLTLP